MMICGGSGVSVDRFAIECRCEREKCTTRSLWMNVTDELGIKLSIVRICTRQTVDADTLMLVTEWKEFRVPSWSVLKKVMRGHVVVDGRNIYDGKELKGNGFNYIR